MGAALPNVSATRTSGGLRIPTPYPDINAVLYELLAGVQAILGDRFVGLYLHGSLAGGDFTPRRSDIDFLVATAVELPEERVLALRALHAHLAAGASPWAAELEGSYIPLPALRRYDPACARHPHVERGGSLNVEQHDSDWVIQRHILREKGICVAGPPPSTLIDPISPAELRQATLGLFRGWWVPMLRDPRRLRSSGYQAYAILTMCRILYTLHFGTIVSKPVAARWALETLDGRWTAVIAQALAWRDDLPLDCLDETLALIQYTLERSSS